MRRPPTIRHWLSLLLAAFIVPATLAVAALFFHSYGRERAGIERANLDVARALMQAIDRELASASAALEALATSPTLDAPDLHAFQAQAQDVLRTRPGNLLVLSGPDLQQLVNTGRAWGSVLPAHGNPERIRRLFGHAAAPTSNLYPGPTVGRLLTSVHAPVVRARRVRYILSMQYLGERLGAILERQQIPPGSSATIYDGDARVVWTSRARRADVGLRASAVLAAGLARGPEGIVDDGPGVIVFSRSSVSDWSVAIALQRSVLTASLWRSLALIVPGAVLVLVLGLALVDANNRYVRVNRALCRLLGASSEQLVGTAQDGFGDSGDNAIEREFQQDLSSGRSESVQYERHYRTRDGRNIWALVSSTLLATDHDPRHFLIQVNDVTDRKRAEEELAHLAHLAHHDALTGVANRAMLNEQVERELAVAQRRGGRLAVVFIDLDFFKHINDSCGHETGDQVLKELAARLTGSVRAIDIVGRIGGDEFVVVLSEVSDAREVLTLTDKLRLACARPPRFNGHEVRIAVSMGVSLFPDDATDFRTLLRYADSALYQAKGEGRNNVQFYRPELTVRMELRIRLGAGLRLALERNELELYYQPIVGLHDGRLVAAEALLRWHHPELGLLMPDVFLPMLEESSMGDAIGAWAIDQVCRQAAHWQAVSGAGLRIGVNVTAAQFKSGRLVATVSEALRTTGLDPALLCIEITEQNQLADTGQIRATMNALKERNSSRSFGV